VDVISGPLIILDERDCAALGRQLVEAIRLGYRGHWWSSLIRSTG